MNMCYESDLTTDCVWSKFSISFGAKQFPLEFYQIIYAKKLNYTCVLVDVRGTVGLRGVGGRGWMEVVSPFYMGCSGSSTDFYDTFYNIYISEFYKFAL